MGKLTAKERKSLPKGDFAIPGKRAFPLPDRSHGANALARSSNKSPAVKAEVRRAVAKKFPGLINNTKGKR